MPLDQGALLWQIYFSDFSEALVVKNSSETTLVLRQISSTPGGIYYVSASLAVPQCSVKTLPLATADDRPFISPYLTPQVDPANCSEQRNQINKDAVIPAASHQNQRSKRSSSTVKLFEKLGQLAFMLNIKRRFRRQFNWILSLLSMALLIGFSACGQPSVTSDNSTAIQANNAGATPTEFRIGYQLTAGPETLTKGLKVMEEQFPDVSIRWLPFDSGLAVNDAIAEGNIDVGLTGSVPAAIGVAEELPYQIYFILNLAGDNEALIVTPESNIASIADLPGKTIAVPFGSTSHFSLLSALKQQDIDPGQVNILDMQPQDMLAAWQLGEIDGGFVWQPILSRMSDEGGNIVITCRELAKVGIITADLGIVRNEFADQYPDFLNDYVKALNTVIEMYQEDPKAASEAISTEIALSPEESLEVMNELVWLDATEQSSKQYMGISDAPGALSQVLKDSADFLVDQGVLSSAPDLKAYKSALFHNAIADVKS